MKRISKNKSLTTDEIGALKVGDKVWQIGNRRAPDRELIVKSVGPAYVTFTRSIKFSREYNSLTNERRMYWSKEDMEAEKLIIQRAEKVINLMNDCVKYDNLPNIKGLLSIFSTDEFNYFYERLKDKWPGSL
ncbi:hypothetical protein ABN36_18310 [Salmonella enterica subsp. enterica]|nr:hypothetical protein [Salmonella enterica subsp. enterica]